MRHVAAVLAVAVLLMIPAPAAAQQSSGGWIEGRLTTADTGQPLPEGFRVGINYYDAAGAAGGGDAAFADADGRYRLGPVPPGTYKLLFLDTFFFVYEGVACPCTLPDGSPGLHVGWWRDKADFASADAVEIRLNEVTVVDWSLRQTREIPQPPVAPPEELPFTGGWEIALIPAAGALLLAGLLVLRKTQRAIGS